MQAARQIKETPEYSEVFCYTVIREMRNGAAQSVIIAAKIIETLEMVPDTELSSNAFDVPAPCALVPSRTPLAISLSIRK